VNSFTRIQWFQPTPGIFDVLVNLLWAVLHVHRGSINSAGSLAHWFSTVLDRKRLSSPQLDFHTLRSSPFQILDGLLLACWSVGLNKRGCPYFASFSASEPSPGGLIAVAADIICSYANPGDPSPHPLPVRKRLPTKSKKRHLDSRTPPRSSVISSMYKNYLPRFPVAIGDRSRISLGPSR